MNIAIGSDHAGFEYKERLKLALMELGHDVTDFGTESEEPIDYPQIVFPLAEAVAAEDFERGIVVGGSGNGEAIAANRIHGVRCATCWNVKSAVYSRKHNNANMLAIGQRLLEFETVTEIVEAWLLTHFEGGRHLRRVQMLDRDFTRNGGERHPLPHRANMRDHASWVCNSCGEEFTIQIDLSAGHDQQLIDECPVCSHENEIVISIDQQGNVGLSGLSD